MRVFYKNEPKQEYVARGYFEIYEIPIRRDNHPDFMSLKVLVTQKGLAFLNKLFEGELCDKKMAKIS